MASQSPTRKLAPDEFALIFDSDRGVELNELGIFFQRLATVGRRAGAELLVVALEPGSLKVVFKAAAKNAKKEFNKAPVATTASGMAIGGGLVGVVTAAVVAAMSLGSGQATPLAKAGADLVQNQEVTKIELVTINQTFVVMDDERVAEVRAIEDQRRAMQDDYGQRALPAPAEVRRLISHARQGQLAGEVHVAAGTLHFRPDGYRYMVPIDMDESAAADMLESDKHYQVTGEIIPRRGQPDRIIIDNAILLAP